MLFRRAAKALVSLLIILTAAPMARAEEPKPGGVMRLLAKGAAGTLDPQINYNIQFLQVNYILYDGLVAYRKAAGAAGFDVVADLAEALPVPDQGGTRYVFRLRKGVKFSNGQEVGVADVVASFQRLFKIGSPTSGTFYNHILGADQCLKKPASCTLKDGVMADAKSGTVTIKLTAPDPEFLQKLAFPHAAILPANTPLRDMGTESAPGTGPYKIESFDPTKLMKLVRNPFFHEWSHDAQPAAYPDVVDYAFGLSEEAAITAIENGQADWMFEPPPADRLAELGTKYASQVQLHPLTAIWYAPMNTHLPPFNDIRVRRAVNYAIDRSALVKLFGGGNLAVPSCQILPPGFPGYDPYCPYSAGSGVKWSAPDLAKARQLVEESGTKGMEVTVISEDYTVARALGVYLQGVLADLGYKASVKPISQNIELTYIQNTNNKVQISVTQWYQDYPAASDFLNVLFGCASYVPGTDASINISGLCDPELDRAMGQAMATSDPGESAMLWSKLDRRVTDLAPVAVLFNPRRVDFISRRVKNFTFSNQFFWIFSLSSVQ